MSRQLFLLGCAAAFALLLCRRSAQGQGYSPQEAPRRMTVAEGFTVTLVASEPEVRQPILVKFDDRGRLWVIQYLQYPNPAGLKRVAVDRYSRTVYDRVPEPPPKGPRGADRITICEDTDGDGQADRFKDFVDGLNLATGLAFGHGGVFVIQAPYLLYYPDRDRDDVPDSDPQVLLNGFGMEDAQALANHLTWGPDGWLYGLNGSTTTCRIRGIEFQQGVWRYHPVSREFELFCEGGGNCYGLDFDRRGNLFYSSNGSHKVWHGVQGGYYWKQFTKHGGLHNPYTFGFFGSVKRVGDYRGGHVTTGGSFYYGPTFPDRFFGKLIGNNLLAHEVHWHHLMPHGSTFATSHGGELLLANDTWFAPTDLCVGPDGGVYLCDFHDKRTAHPDPDAQWDRVNGRVYRIQSTDAQPAPHVDLNSLASDRLVDCLAHSNAWFVRRARRVLAERRDPAVIPRLREIVLANLDDQLVLEALWALYVSGGLDDEVARQTLRHRSASVRSWTVRLLGDARGVSAEIGPQLVELAKTDSSPLVRSQLASTAKRLPAGQSLAIVRELVLHEEDLKDEHIPLLLWWAVESKAIAAQDELMSLLTTPDMWRTPLVREAILGRLMRRYAAEASDRALEACTRLIAAAPSEADRQMLISALDEGLGGGQLQRIPEVFSKMVAQLGDLRTTRDPRFLRLALRCGVASAHERIVEIAVDRKMPTDVRVAMVNVLGQMGQASGVPSLLSLLEWDEQHDVEVASVKALARFDSRAIPERILKEYPRFSAKLKSLCRQTLFTREDWALQFLRKVDEGEFDAEAVSIEELRGLSVFDDRAIDELVTKHWGRITRGTPEEKLADIRRFNNDLRAFSGDPESGYAVFKEHCGKCHKLFGEGEDIGPDLTTANRKDRQYVLVSTVDPSSYIRTDYLSVQVVTEDGRILSGLITEETPTTITLVNSNSESTTISRDNIDELLPSQISQMPEDLLKQLKPQQLRDLFAYLESESPTGQ
jgi:putative membrane-bound dehydrogenase-like protein